LQYFDMNLGMKSSLQKTQHDIFLTPLHKICDLSHEIIRLADSIDWQALDDTFGESYCEDNGRPAKIIRLMIGLHYLKAIFGESDESVVAKWVENPYWQYFCGERDFQHEFPIEPTSMVKWRRRIEKKGLNQLLEESIKAGLKAGALQQKDLKHINVDTTVMEKAISYPTDAGLYVKMIVKLIKVAKDRHIKLRQSYVRKSKQAFVMQCRYRHARQMKRANREVRKLRTYLGRLLRDVDRKQNTEQEDAVLKQLLSLGLRLWNQKREDKNKLYSLHASEVECIAKGKAHKKYEFGCKVGVVVTSQGSFILGSQALHGNPYDGHQLKEMLDQARGLLPESLRLGKVYCDLGFRGHNETKAEVNIVGRKLKHLSQGIRKWFKRRAAIEPVIGHMKNDGRDPRNHLLGVKGDCINATMMSCGFNLRQCLRALALFWQKYFNEIFRFRVVEARLAINLNS